MFVWRVGDQCTPSPQPSTSGASWREASSMLDYVTQPTTEIGCRSSASVLSGLVLWALDLLAVDSIDTIPAPLIAPLLQFCRFRGIHIISTASVLLELHICSVLRLVVSNRRQELSKLLVRPNSKQCCDDYVYIRHTASYTHSSHGSTIRCTFWAVPVHQTRLFVQFELQIPTWSSPQVPEMQERVAMTSHPQSL